MGLSLVVLLALGAAGGAPPGQLVLFTSEQTFRDQGELSARLAAAIEATGRRARDVQREREAFFCGPLERCPWTEGRLGESIPVEFPAEYRDDLRQGLEACRGVAQAVAAPGDPRVLTCGAQLQAALWQRFVERSGGAAYLKLNAMSYHRTDLVLTGYLAGEASERELRAVGEPTPEVLRGLVEAFFRGEGQARPRWATTELPRPPSAEERLVAGGTFAPLPALPVPARCPKLGMLVPRPFEVPLNRVLQHRWLLTMSDAHLPGQVPLVCDPAGVPAKGKGAPRVRLSCQQADRAASFETPLPGSLDDPKVMDQVSAELIRQALAWSCAHP